MKVQHVSFMKDSTLTPEETQNLIPLTSELQPPVELGCSPVVECVLRLHTWGPTLEKKKFIKAYTDPQPQLLTNCE